MKRYINSIFVALLAGLTFTACTEDMGSDVGGDGSANLVVYEYDTTVPNNPDNDATYRVATNNRTSELYYLAEPTEAAQANGSATQAYADRVVANGTKVTIAKDAYSGGNIADVVVKDMKGDYTVTFVAVNGAQKTMSQSKFFGIEWIDAVSGTYTFSARSQSRLGLEETKKVTVQYCKTEPDLYRFADLYGAGRHLKFRKTENVGKDDKGNFNFLRVEAQTTPFTFSSYGTVSVRDVAYWKNDEKLATSAQNGCYMYSDGTSKNSVVLNIQLYVSAGNLGNATESFVAE